MDSKKANRLLERITALHKSLVGTADNDISSIEKDLMLSYLRQFYEEYAHLGTEEVVKPTQKVTEALKPAAPTPKVVVKPRPAPPPPAPPKPAAAVEESPATSSVHPPPPPPPPAPKPAPAPNPPAPAPTVSMNAKVAALFAPPEMKELSDRLAQTPIKDLTRALTINNRVQFANVLFSGNSDLMNSVLKRLNGLGTFAAAKPILAELANDQNWTDPETAPVAKDFIKLVSRRYV